MKEQILNINGHQLRVVIQEDADTVEVLVNHWDPFFVNIAGRYGLTEARLREDFAAEQ